MKTVKDMLSPVECLHCGKVYDLTEGKPVHRFADCTVFITPCCSKQVDDRTWISLPHIRRLTNEEAERLVHGYCDYNGFIRRSAVA